MLEYIKEQDNLTRQVHLLQWASITMSSIQIYSSIMF